MNEKTIKISKKIIIKIFFLFMVLLTVTFLLGLYLGRGAISGKLTYSVEEECKENLDACSFRIQELSLKYQEIVKIARKKGIIDKNNRSVQNIVCEKKENSDKTEKNKAAKSSSDENKKTEKNFSDKKNLKKEKHIEKSAVKTPAKKHQPRKDKPEKQSGREKKQKTQPEKKKPSIKKNVWEEIDTLKEEGDFECRYALQLFSGTSRNQAKAAQKNISVKNTRIVKGNVDGNVWYRIRYGCFSTKTEAEKELLSISAKVRNPIIVEAD